ncbi:MAG: GEVED domain-containing protein [Bacteroidales bacterium]|nr:GEVED domain-containing protein [Bacteroidales bacterium]
MKRVATLILSLLFAFAALGQKPLPGKIGQVVHPTVIKKPVGFSISAPLRDAPIVTTGDLKDEEFYMNRHRDRVLNPDIFPPDFNNMPPDPGEQTQMGWVMPNGRGLDNNYAGQNSPYYPPDCNGTVGPSHYFQVVNLTYQIFNKSDGSSAAGPSDLNTIFDPGLPGVGCNDGDPIVLWDEHADRWFYAEFSLCGANDYMLIAVSTSNDPTGTWYSWSFDVDDKPDYMKFGIWQDGYYMATNTANGNDVYVFERDAMIAGNASPTMVGFDNPSRPSTFDGFHCLLPLDNDSSWAPVGSPGQFITIADDGQGNAADELRIYELSVDWATPSNSTFSMVQQLGVNVFSGNFTGDWNNIPQPGTTQKLDGISTVLMFRAQYRNFGGTQKLVCTHTIAETSSESAIRWYQLEKTTGNWSILQQGTYNPDNVSRWNASIAMNDAGQIAMGYSVSDGSSTYPGIRYCGQTVGAPSGTMDVAEVSIWTGAYSQTGANRWGDYCNISVDPSDGNAFWYTNEYQGSSTHGTRIAKITLPAGCTPPTTQASNYALVSATNNSLDISWTRGNGDSVLVVAREGGSVNSDPVSGITYTASAAFGAGNEIGTGNFVVYNGTGTSETITGLTSGKTYYFSFYEFLTLDHCYLTPDYEGSSTTLGPPSLTTATVSNIAGTTATSGGNITSDNGAAVTARGVCWNTVGTPTVTDPKTSDGSGTGTFISNMTGLSPVTTYYVRAYATNSYGTSYGNEETFTTACGTVTAFPFSQNFDTWTNSSPGYTCTADGTVSLEDCWTNATGDDIDWDIFSGATGSGSTGPSSGYGGSGTYLYTESSSCYGSTGYVNSPSLDLTSLTNPELQFYYHMYGSSMGTLSVQVSTDGGTTWSGDIWSKSGDQGNQWNLAVVSLNAYVSSNNVVIRFKAVTGASYTSDMAIDEVTVVASCAQPSQQATSFSATNINNTDLTVNWVRGDGSNVLVLAREGSPVNEEPVSGVSYNADADFSGGDAIGSGNFVIYNGAGTSVIVTSLDTGTNYHFAIHEFYNTDNCYTSPALTGNATTAGPAPCTPCVSNGSTSLQTGTTNVAVNTLNNASGKPAAYSDYTSMSADMEVGNTRNLSIRVNTDGSYTVHTLVWIDWNQNCDFTDAGEQYDLGTATNVADGLTSLSPLGISVPSDALLGATTMRVSTKYNADPTACETGFDGEVEDYTIIVRPGSTTWNGSTVDWHDPSNWPFGVIPNSSYRVIIPTTPANGKFPVIQNGINARCYSITLEAGATITVNGSLEEMK